MNNTGDNRHVYDDAGFPGIGYDLLDLCLQGESTIMQRKEMLAKKRESLLGSIRELEDSVAYIDWKQNFYDEVLSGTRPYVSNLIRTEE